MIVIIDYGMGNLGSIANMLKKVGAKDVLVSADEKMIRSAAKIILPGVGAFDAGMSRLRELNLIPILNEKVLVEKTPVLGLCLGMQLLMQSSEEGREQGLGWIKGCVVRFRFDPARMDLKIPHMGWNNVRILNPGTLFQGMDDTSRFYFVHSYYVVSEDETNILTKTEYGFEFASAVQNANIMGTQFHPEKSHKYGMQLFRNFVEIA